MIVRLQWLACRWCKSGKIGLHCGKWLWRSFQNSSILSCCPTQGLRCFCGLRLSQTAHGTCKLNPAAASALARTYGLHKLMVQQVACLSPHTHAWYPGRLVGAACALTSTTDAMQVRARASLAFIFAPNLAAADLGAPCGAAPVPVYFVR